MRSLAGNAENIANPNLPLNHSKTVWKAKPGLLCSVTWFLFWKEEIPAKDEGNCLSPWSHTDPCSVAEITALQDQMPTPWDQAWIKNFINMDCNQSMAGAGPLGSQAEGDVEKQH